MRIVTKFVLGVVIGLISGQFMAIDASASSDTSGSAQGIKPASYAILGMPEASYFFKTKREIEFSTDWLDGQPEARNDDQLKCLAEALYFEARGESVKGQFAVAEVILNRVESARFPDTACNVINQGTGQKYQCQFTYTCDGLKEVINEPRAFERVSKVAQAALDGVAPELTNGATHYHTKAVNPRWSRVYRRTTSIGTHIFYRHTWQTASN